jgi:hypothetical protein
MSCASSCKAPGTHSSYGECLRSKGIAVTGLESTNPSFSRDRSKAWDSELALYESAVKQGIQPATTERKDIEYAIAQSDSTGVAFDAAASPLSTAADAAGL